MKVTHGGPVDFIGDVHGCLEPLQQLVALLGYQHLEHPEGRKLCLLGDLVDRGPDSFGVLQFAQALTAAGHFVLMGNHDDRLRRYLKGNPVLLTDELLATVSELPDTARAGLLEWLNQRPGYLVATVGDASIVAAHGGLHRDLVGSTTKGAWEHCLYGEVGQQPFGTRTYRWVSSYPEDGNQWCVFGHTAFTSPVQYGRVYGIDTGCVFGGPLTALRFPELRLVQTLVENPPLTSEGGFSPSIPRGLDE